MLQIDPEIVEKFEVFVVFDAISDEFPRFFVKGSNTINNERTSYALHFLKRMAQRFASKTLQNDSKYIKKIQHLRFYTTYVYFLKRFGIRMMGNVPQRLNSYFCRLLKKFLQTSVEKRIKLDRKKMKMSKFLSTPGLFN